MRPSAFANMDNAADLMGCGHGGGDLGEESTAMSKISDSRTGLREGVRRSDLGPAGRAYDIGEEMELSEVHQWQREGSRKETSTRSRPKSTNDLAVGVKVHISTAVRWDEDEGPRQ